MNGDVASGSVDRPVGADRQVDSPQSFLVVGDVDNGHGAACQRLAEHTETGHRIRGATASPTCADTDTWYADTGSGAFNDLSLSELGMALTDAITNLDATDGGLHACIDGLPCPEQDSDDELTLFRFVHAVTNRVDVANGTIHIHLESERDDPLVAKFEPLFDTVIELRDVDNTVEARSYSWLSEDGQWVPVSSL